MFLCNLSRKRGKVKNKNYKLNCLNSSEKISIMHSEKQRNEVIRQCDLMFCCLNAASLLLLKCAVEVPKLHWFTLISAFSVCSSAVWKRKEICVCPTS